MSQQTPLKSESSEQYRTVGEKVLLPISRFTVRFHLGLILCATFFSGWGASHFLLKIGLESMATRYLCASLASYFVFLILARLWLRSLADSARTRRSKENNQRVHAHENWMGPEAAVSKKNSREWDGDDVADAIELGSIATDADDLIVIALFIVAIAIFGWGASALIELPFLFLEGVFYGILTGALAKTARRIDDPDWTGNVLRETIIPFVIVAVLVAAIGLFAKAQCPDAVTLKQALFCSFE